MSELSELIKINKNIEKQNEEIIRLLNLIAGEKDDKPESSTGKFNGLDFVIPYVQMPSDDSKQAFDISGSDVEDVLSGELDVGEVYFIEEDAFKLSVNNNETVIDNLTGSGECSDYSLIELVANESVKHNKALEAGTVIITEASNGKLPQTMKVAIDRGAKKAYLPWKQSMELLGAPQKLQTMVKLDLYRNEDHLIEKLFKKEEE